ncbi:hypothetical protein D9M69_631330 [compost metagenome]
MTAPCGASARARPSVASQPARSASVSAMPRLILSTLAGGWWSSPSISGSPNAVASAAPMLDLPQPETPITTSQTLFMRALDFV